MRRPGVSDHCKELSGQPCDLDHRFPLAIHAESEISCTYLEPDGNLAGQRRQAGLDEANGVTSRVGKSPKHEAVHNSRVEACKMDSYDAGGATQGGLRSSQDTFQVVVELDTLRHLQRLGGEDDQISENDG